MKPDWGTVLFDLDGTLVDSAPDLAGAANALRQKQGLPALPLAHLRPWVGAGARGMVYAALGVEAQSPEFEPLKSDFLSLYEARLSQESKLFEGVKQVLTRLSGAGVQWGIVTNKIERYAVPLLQALELDTQAAVVICGDTTPFAKPHPQPLLEAARRLGVAASQCVYVGDDLRGMQAGAAAGMQTVAAAWGYLGAQADVTTWGAHHVSQTPHDFLVQFFPAHNVE